MAFFHFVNCVALAFAPYAIAYKYSGLAEYSSVWKCARAALGFFLAQLVKLLVLATFFPAGDGGENFALVPELLKCSADFIDVLGMHVIINYFMTGKSEVRFLSVGLGWAAAYSASSRVALFWSGARATAFHWRYMQSAFDSSSDLLFYISMACLVWLAPRNDLPASGRRMAVVLTAACVFHQFMFSFLRQQSGIVGWAFVGAKALFAVVLSAATLVVYGTLNYHANYYGNKRD